MLKNILTVLTFLLALGTFAHYYFNVHLALPAASIIKKQIKQPIFPLSSFVKIEKITSILICEEQKKKKRRRKKKKTATCLEGKFKVVASGFVVSGAKEGSYIMSAAHVCYDTNEIENLDLEEHAGKLEPKLSVKIASIDLYAYGVDNVKHEIVIVDFFGTNDLCFLYGESLNVPSIPAAPVDATVGDKVYNIAAPTGFHFANVIPILDGYYSGLIKERNAMYTIPSTGGSSGSPILNKNGEYIGMVVAAVNEFEHITISPKRADIIKFISNILYNKTCGELYYISPHFSNDL